LNIEATLFLVFLTISFLIGAFASRSVKNLSDYFVAGARMPWFFIAGTFIASTVSTGLFLGATNMTARNGYAMWSSYVTTSIGFFLGIAVIGVLVRRLSDHFEVLDFADILAVRYSSRGDAIRIVTTIVLPLVYIPLLAAQLIGLATIASGIFELPYHTVLTIITVVVIAYTMLGGMLGVVWTDGFQFLVLMLGLLLAVPLAMTEFGAGDVARGWQELSARSDVIFDWSSGDWPWYLVLGQCAWIFAIPVQPHLVTRFLTAKDERSILIALPVCLTAGAIIFTSTVPIGLLGQAVGSEGENGGYAYIALARNLLSPWLGAFALAGVAAAALSTCSTVLIVTGQSLSREVYQKWITPDASEQHALFAARASVLLVGAVTFIIAWFEILGIFWLVVLSASLLASIFFVPIFAGFFSIKAGATGALAAMISGGVAAIVVYVINKQFDAHFFISEVFAGLFFSGLAMWIANRWYPATAEERDVLKTLGLR
jgi:Na+/proline symporter